MLFPSPGSVLSTLHGQGHVVARGVRFLMGPSQRESHRLWSGRSLQRDVADTQSLRGFSQSSEAVRMHHHWKMRHNSVKKCRRSLEKEKWKRRETERERQRKTDRCSLTQSLPIMTSQMKGFNFLQHFSKATDVLFMADVSWPWQGYDTHWLAWLHPFSKPNSCAVSRPFLPHRSPDSHSPLHRSMSVFGLCGTLSNILFRYEPKLSPIHNGPIH